MRKILTSIILVMFLANTLVPPAFAQVLVKALDLPVPGAMVELSTAFMPPVLKGMNVDTQHPFKFDFILDVGDSTLNDDGLRTEANKLIRYFLASMAIPDKDLWVNLSPQEQDRIITDEFSSTEMGRDMLAQDYILKQITSSLIYPESDSGKAFWSRVYEKAQALYGTTDIPTDTFNKVWVVPHKAEIYEDGTKVFITGASLQVMLDTDYVASQAAPDADDTQLARDVMREVIIPVLEKEVNEGANFIQLRQAYYALILAKWYKETLKDSLLNQKYADRKKMDGVDLADTGDKQKIYARYLEALKKGVFNYVKDERDVNSKELIPRKYFAGGVNFAEKVTFTRVRAISVTGRERLKLVIGKYAKAKAGHELVMASELTPENISLFADDPVNQVDLPDEMRLPLETKYGVPQKVFGVKAVVDVATGSVRFFNIITAHTDVAKREFRGGTNKHFGIEFQVAVLPGGKYVVVAGNMESKLMFDPKKTRDDRIMAWKLFCDAIKIPSELRKDEIPVSIYIYNKLNFADRVLPRFVVGGFSNDLMTSYYKNNVNQQELVDAVLELLRFHWNAGDGLPSDKILRYDLISKHLKMVLYDNEAEWNKYQEAFEKGIVPEDGFDQEVQKNIAEYFFALRKDVDVLISLNSEQGRSLWEGWNLSEEILSSVRHYVSGSLGAMQGVMMLGIPAETVVEIFHDIYEESKVDLAEDTKMLVDGKIGVRDDAGVYRQYQVAHLKSRADQFLVAAEWDGLVSKGKHWVNIVKESPKDGMLVAVRSQRGALAGMAFVHQATAGGFLRNDGGDHYKGKMSFIDLIEVRDEFKGLYIDQALIAAIVEETIEAAPNEGAFGSLFVPADRVGSLSDFYTNIGFINAHAHVPTKKMTTAGRFETVWPTQKGKVLLGKAAEKFYHDIVNMSEDSRIRKADKAESKSLGGIDLNSEKIDLSRSGKRSELDWGTSEAELENIQINGLSPVISAITPVDDLVAVFPVLK